MEAIHGGVDWVLVRWLVYPLTFPMLLNVGRPVNKGRSCVPQGARQSFSGFLFCPRRHSSSFNTILKPEVDLPRDILWGRGVDPLLQDNGLSAGFKLLDGGEGRETTTMSLAVCRAGNRIYKVQREGSYGSVFIIVPKMARVENPGQGTMPGVGGRSRGALDIKTKSPNSYHVTNRA